MELRRTVTTEALAPEVFRYLADFTTTTEWDPGTVRTTLLSGDGGPGTRYRNVSRFLGRQTELTYVVERLEPDALIRLRGENKTVVATDTITVATGPDGGSTVTYQAVFAFKGAARLVAPLLRPAFQRLGDEAEKGLRAALSRLAV